MATIYAQDTDNESNVYLARRLLNKALSIVKELERENVRLEICIYENLSSVSNRLEKFNDSLNYIQRAYSLIDSSRHFMFS